MTRGKLIIITQNGVFSSSEFNGDMYPEGNGENAIEALKEVVDYDSFSKAVEAFNDCYYEYPKEEINIYKLGNTIKEAFTDDFRKNYFKIFFSDYLYIKNISGKKITIPSIREDDTLTEISLEENEIVWLYFGKYEGSFPILNNDSIKKGKKDYFSAVKNVLHLLKISHILEENDSYKIIKIFTKKGIISIVFENDELYDIKAKKYEK